MGDAGLGGGGGEDPEGVDFCPACPPFKAAEERAWENQVAPAPGDDLNLTLTLRNKELKTGEQQGHMNSPGVVRAGALEPQPAPNVLVSWGTTAPPTAPPKPRQFPRGTACTLEAAHGEDSVHTRPALPLSSVPTPSPAGQWNS